MIKSISEIGGHESGKCQTHILSYFFFFSHRRSETCCLGILLLFILLKEFLFAVTLSYKGQEVESKVKTLNMEAKDVSCSCIKKNICRLM